MGATTMDGIIPTAQRPAESLTRGAPPIELPSGRRRGFRRRRGFSPGVTTGIGIAILVLVVPTTGVLAVHAGSIPASHKAFTQQQLFNRHIKHIVIIMMENHGYDNYFGVYCQQVGKYCPNTTAGIPSGTCVPLYPNVTNSTCAVPYNYTRANMTITSPMMHGEVPSISAWNNGSMNNFYLAEHSGLDPFGHYNGSTAPLYWDLAQEYALGDHFFSSSLSYSLANHWFIIAGTAPPESVNSTLIKTADKKVYLRQANNTTSAEDLLLGRSGVTWRYYDYGLSSWTAAQAAQIGIGIPSRGAYNYWNPQAAKYESYTPKLDYHFVPNTRFFADALNGTLPNISWVMPYARDSDHPPENVTRAEAWVSTAIDSVEASPEWNTTAVFLSWDDYGGWWDNMAPPVLFGTQMSFRVPLIVISPYTPAGLVVKTTAAFSSLLSLVEARYGLGCLSVLDCFSAPPLDYFNFSMHPRAPILFPTLVKKLTYPATLAPAAPGMLNAWRAPVNFTNDPNGNGPDVD
ncbi:MAG: alkaline phosphatase family protein [Candidatus Lutacidiplasmatales archaeon]